MRFVLGRFKTDLAEWRRLIDAHKDLHGEAGLRFSRVWHNADNPAEIFFLFEAEDLQRARAFLEKAGALDRAKQKLGDIPELFFLEDA